MATTVTTRPDSYFTARVQRVYIEAEAEFPLLRAAIAGTIPNEIDAIANCINAARHSADEAGKIARQRVREALAREVATLNQRVDSGTGADADDDLWLRIADIDILDII